MRQRDGQANSAQRKQVEWKTYIGSSPSPTKIVDTPASITDPRHRPSLIPIKKANKIMTLAYVSGFLCTLFAKNSR